VPYYISGEKKKCTSYLEYSPIITCKYDALMAVKMTRLIVTFATQEPLIVLKCRSQSRVNTYPSANLIRTGDMLHSKLK